MQREVLSTIYFTKMFDSYIHDMQSLSVLLGTQNTKIGDKNF